MTLQTRGVISDTKGTGRGSWMGKGRGIGMSFTMYVYLLNYLESGISWQATLLVE